ncbi:hypothetical protein HDU88_006721 [Geranomyces variabilis]|nr:hypothetical protein HDU88_006721 [Geranomyces variabilis]
MQQNNGTHKAQLAGTNELIAVIADLMPVKKKRKLGVDYIHAEGGAQGDDLKAPGKENDSAFEGDAEGEGDGGSPSDPNPETGSRGSWECTRRDYIWRRCLPALVDRAHSCNVRKFAEGRLA